MFPIRDDQPRFSTPYVNYFIIALNVLVYLFFDRVRNSGGINVRGNQPRGHSSYNWRERRNRWSYGGICVAIPESPRADAGRADCVYHLLVDTGLGVSGILVLDSVRRHQYER